MNNDNDLNLHSMTKLSGWLRYWVLPVYGYYLVSCAIYPLQEVCIKPIVACVGLSGCKCPENVPY